MVMDETEFRLKQSQRMKRAKKLFHARFCDHVQAELATDPGKSILEILRTSPRLHVAFYGGSGETFNPVTQAQLSECARIAEDEERDGIAHLFLCCADNLHIFFNRHKAEFIDLIFISPFDGQPLSI